MSADTPLMQQYKKIKEEYKNEILMFRLGDFYEMFFEDAKTASKELGLTLTKRNREKGQDVPLAGVPYHSVASYIAKLIEKGYSVAICDQVEDPKSATGIVKREVTRVITPGTIIDVDFLDKNNNVTSAVINTETDKNMADIIAVYKGEYKLDDDLVGSVDEYQLSLSYIEVLDSLRIEIDKQ